MPLMDTSSYRSFCGLTYAVGRTVKFPVTKILMFLLLLTVLVKHSIGNDNPKPEVPLTQVSLEELGEIEVTTASKQPVKARAMAPMKTRTEFFICPAFKCQTKSGLANVMKPATVFGTSSKI